jgi:hypothetical protein
VKWSRCLHPALTHSIIGHGSTTETYRCGHGSKAGLQQRKLNSAHPPKIVDGLNDLAAVVERLGFYVRVILTRKDLRLNR